MAGLTHCPTGIDGLDKITDGGLPAGRTTLVAGGAGCGKTLLATEFLVRGVERGEAGVLLAFEETAEELAANVASLGWDLDRLQAEGKLVVDYVKVDREQIDMTGDYDLEALFIRLGLAIDEVGAKRVALDTLEVLFAALDDTARLRSELRRLFAWLKGKGVTSVITAESGGGSITRHGLEEYVADCVISLDHRVSDQMAVRRIRVVKLRGSTHATNEFPFVIGATGFSVVPVTSFGLEHPASTEAVPTGVAGLDAMLGRGGWFRGSVTMVSGESGTGKTTFAAAFADAACSRGQKCLYMAFEESAAQLARNMSSVGLRLDHWMDEGLLRVHANRPTELGLERHLTTVYEQVELHDPDVVVLDPVTDFTALGGGLDIKALLMRIVDYLKNRQVTAVFTSLNHPLGEDTALSSLIDNFVHLRMLENGAQRRRSLFIQKARGMAHSHHVRGFELSEDGIDILDAVAEAAP
ncbi:circadian clock protein KaiC [Acidiferrimicrobium sp. IK]|uniref:circadian clock protein KaiC n=1 Tax=Acidiferrimicrobium sp. IK TaxID=2871700 RepID=UPI0021CB0BC3|nr:circadian clock protein KaiC [Acidiferrimicrobium sp. IK]MCU4183373.1 circadian clock protein KaiC [Acidiferrimicrobium sp. IK]